MSILKRLFSSHTPQNSSNRPKFQGNWDYSFNGACQVNHETALSIPAYFACVRVIANSIASAPIGMHNGLRDGKSERFPQHPLEKLLAHKPNGFQTPYDFKMYMTAALVTKGNAYAQKVIQNGRITALIPLNPDRVTPFFDTSSPTLEVAYRVHQKSGEERILLNDEMFHIRAFPDDTGLKGQSAFKIGVQPLIQQKLIRDHEYNTLKNGARKLGAFTHPNILGDEAFERLKEDMKGAENSGKTMILEGGMKFESISMSFEDAQIIEQYKLNRADIASIFGVPLHKINDLTNATFSNIEQQAMEFYTDCILPFQTAWEEAIARDLIIAPEFYFAAFNMDGLLRGDAQSRGEFYSKMISSSAMTPNEVRAKENLNPIDGLDEVLTPLNMATRSQIEESAKNGS